MIEFVTLLGMIIGLIEFYMIIAWWGNGCISGVEALALFGLDFLLLAALLNSPLLGIRFIIMLLLFAPYLWVYLTLNGSSPKDVYENEARKYRAAIDSDPSNWGAREYLAHTLYKQGDIEGAMAEMQLAVDLNPDPGQGKYYLKQWDREKRELKGGVVVCSHCGEENSVGRNWCHKCEKKLYRFQEKPIHQKLGLAGFIAVFGAVTVIVASMSMLRSAYALIPIACTLIALAGWRLSVANR